MPREHLKQTLEQLHDELGRHPAIDEPTRRLLLEVMTEIAALLDASGEASEHARESLVGRLRESTRDFETSHPTLTATVGQLADALSRAGI